MTCGPNNHPIDKLMKIARDKLGSPSNKAVMLRCGIQASTLSKIRHSKQPPSAEVILRLYDLTGLSIEKIREELGIARYTDVSAHTHAQQAGAQQSAQN